MEEKTKVLVPNIVGCCNEYWKGPGKLMLPSDTIRKCPECGGVANIDIVNNACSCFDYHIVCTACGKDFYGADYKGEVAVADLEDITFRFTRLKDGDEVTRTKAVVRSRLGDYISTKDTELSKAFLRRNEVVQHVWEDDLRTMSKEAIGIAYDEYIAELQAQLDAGTYKEYWVKENEAYQAWMKATEVD